MLYAERIHFAKYKQSWLVCLLFSETVDPLSINSLSLYVKQGDLGIYFSDRAYRLQSEREARAHEDLQGSIGSVRVSFEHIIECLLYRNANESVVCAIKITDLRTYISFALCHFCHIIGKQLHGPVHNENAL